MNAKREEQTLLYQCDEFIILGSEDGELKVIVLKQPTYQPVEYRELRIPILSEIPAALSDGKYSPNERVRYEMLTLERFAAHGKRTSAILLIGFHPQCGWVMGK